MKYLDIYRDSAYSDKWASVPVNEIRPSWVSIGSQTVTLGGKSYEYYDFSNGCLLNGISTPRAAPLISWAKNRFPERTILYFKNGLRVTYVVESGSECRFENFFVDDYDLNLSANNSSVSENDHPNLWAISFKQNGKTFIGFNGFANVAGTLPDYFRPCCCFEESFWEDALKPPYSYGEGNDPDGGQGLGPDTFRRTGVTDTSPPAGLIPAGASGRGLHTYLISATDYGDLQNYLWGDSSTLAKSLWQKFQNKTHSPVSCIVAVYTLPADFMPTAGTATNIRIAGVTLPISVYSADLGFAVHSFEFAPIEKPFGNFADFSHVTCKLYVPFCGEIPIPVEAAYNRTVGVRYWVDQFNGNLVARVYCGDINIGELSSNVAYRIPIVGGDDGSLDRIGAAMTGIAQITAGNYAGALGSLAEELTAPYVTQLVNADFSGSMSACTFRRPYIEWTANNDYYSNEFFKTRGVPARYGATLSSFSGGYLECESRVDSVDIPSATDAERQEIENLLRGGIYA